MNITIYTITSEIIMQGFKVLIPSFYFLNLIIYFSLYYIVGCVCEVYVGFFFTSYTYD